MLAVTPLRYTDPTGHDPTDWDAAWVTSFIDAHGYGPCEQDWLDRQFSLDHPGSGPGGAWEDRDREAYRDIRMLLGPALLRQIGKEGGPYDFYTLVGRLLTDPGGGESPFADHTSLTASYHVPSDASAWTWGDLIIMHAGYWSENYSDSQARLTVIHEYVHVLQYRERGLSFGPEYVAGGRNWTRNPFEVQAIAVEDWYRRRVGFPAPWTFTWARGERYLAYTRWPW